MNAGRFPGRLQVVVGAGGAGKTTLAAALALGWARAGQRTLVMTFDPSLRLKDALGVSEAAREEPARVLEAGRGFLDAALLDARSTFDRLVRAYAPDDASAQRILANRFYQDMAGTLSGVLEYMAMERLFEMRSSERYDRIVLDTPPTRQAMDFLQAPDRMVHLVDSKIVAFALQGDHNAALRLLARGALDLADRVIGRGFLMDVVEFIRAFAPLFAGFRSRAEEVRRLLRSEETRFLLVAGPGPEQVPDAMFFLRKLAETGHRLGPVLVNQVHPDPGPDAGGEAGIALLRHLADRDARGLALLQRLLPGEGPILAVPLEPIPPANLRNLARLSGVLWETPAL